MKALVTGAAGFIGSHLCDALLARGDTVTALDCFTPYYDVGTKVANAEGFRSAPGCALVQADLRSEPLEPLLEGVDVVFHQAAQAGVRASWDHHFGDYATHNVLATQLLLEACRSAGVGRFVYASSSSVYGNASTYPTREDAPLAPFSPYGVTKLAAEHLCRAYAQNFGLSTVSLRYFTVYGPRQRPDMSIHRLIEASLGDQSFPLFGDGSQVREFTYIDDIVAANLRAATAEVTPGDICNIAGGSEITLADLVELVGTTTGRPITVDRQPAMPGDVSRNGGDIRRAAEVLGWSPAVALADGLQAQIRWHEARRGAPQPGLGGR